MERLAQTEGLTDIQRDILATVRDFTDKDTPAAITAQPGASH